MNVTLARPALRGGASSLPAVQSGRDDADHAAALQARLGRRALSHVRQLRRRAEFASESYDGAGNVAVVRRPRGEDQSDVSYRSLPTPTAGHEIFVMETVFFTGG